MNLEFSAPNLAHSTSRSKTYLDPRAQRANLFSTRHLTAGRLTSQSSPTVGSHAFARADIPSNATPIDLPPDRLDLLYANLSATDQRIVNNWKRQIRTCIFCYKDYLEIENLGQWRCAQQVSDIVESSYMCDKIQVVQQLIRADHRWEYNPMVWMWTDNQVLSPTLTTYLSESGCLNAQSITTSTKGDGCVGVCRFDWRAQQSFRESFTYYTLPIPMYDQFEPFGPPSRAGEPLASRSAEPAHDMLYGKHAPDAHIRLTSSGDMVRTIGSIMDSSDAVEERLRTSRA